MKTSADERISLILCACSARDLTAGEAEIQIQNQISKLKSDAFKAGELKGRKDVEHELEICKSRLSELESRYGLQEQLRLVQPEIRYKSFEQLPDEQEGNATSLGGEE